LPEEEPREVVPCQRCVEGSHAVELRHVDHLPLTCPVPVPDRSHDTHRREEAGPQVAVGLRHLNGGSIGVYIVPCEAAVATQRLGYGGEARPLGVGSSLAEAAEGCVDYVRVQFPEDVVS